MTAADNKKADRDLFGIDLGPTREPDESDDEDASAAPVPVKSPNRTLTERLAAAAAERELPKRFGRTHRR